MNNKKLNLLDLFSGIGGFSLGLESTGGFETIAFVEKDEFCQKVLKKHWPNITIEGDIRNVKGEKYQADVITGGFPCQPFSVAGKRKGTNDDRYLWDETIRVIRECKPRWFIGENVEGLVNIQNGMVLRQVQNDLEKEGFEVQCIIIPASGIGAWHQRKRIWIMAYSNSNRHFSEIRESNAEKKRLQDQDRQINSATGKFIGTSDVWETNNEYVPNTHNSRDRTSQHDINRDWEKNVKEQKELTQFKSSGHSEDVPNSISTGSRRGRIFRNVDEQGWNTFETERESLQSKDKQTRSNDIEQSNANVSNPISLELNRRIDASRISSTEQPRVDSDQKKDWNEIWCEVERCRKQIGKDVSNTNDKRLQGLNSEPILQEQKLGLSTNKNDEGRKTWWQIESELCGIPNGLSTELDKDRTNRVKSLGNSIVPLIARELGLAILEAEKK